MMRRESGLVLAGAAALVATVGFSLGRATEAAKAESRIFEMRTYYANPGKMAALHARFRDHTCKLFEKHGMTNIGYWSPTKEGEAEEKMVYILAFPSREAADKSWAAFRKDPEWLKARSESEKDGGLVKKVESVYLKPTDYSTLK